MDFAAPERVLVREVAPSFSACIRTDSGPPIDVDVARRQHAGYVAALHSLGLRVEALAAEAGCPDGCFVEDTAVVLDGGAAVITRPGAVARRAEVPSVATHLGGHLG